MPKFLRTKDEIFIDYLEDLVENGVIQKDQFENYRTTGKKEILDLLDKKIHETEDYYGARISTLDSFYHFCNYLVKKDVATNRKVWNSLVKKFFLAVERNQYACFMCARGHGKSYFWCLYTLFKAYTNPFFECIIASNTPKMGKRLFRVLNRLIDSNELLFERRNPDNKQDIPNTQFEMEYNHGYFEVTSVGTTPRSAHVSLAIVDDPLRDDKRYSDDFIENYVFGQIYPIVQRKKGRMAISGCVTPETKIITKLGLEQIGDQIVYDPNKKDYLDFRKEVFGKDGWDTTEKFYVNGKVKTNKITLVGGYNLECSEIHPLWVCKNKRDITKKSIKWVRSENINIGDFVAISCGNNIFNNKPTISEDDAYLYGLYISEGNVENNNVNYRLTITNNSKEVVNFLINKGFKTYDGIHYRLNSKDLIKKMENYGIDFQRCYFKSIPKNIFKEPKNIQVSFLRGLYDGDGHSFSSNNSLQVVLTSTSKKLIDDTQQMLLNFGILTAIRKNKPRSHLKKDGYLIKGGISYSLCASNYNAQIFLKEIGFNIGYKNKINNKLFHKPKKHFGFIWRRVKSIEKNEAHTVDFVIPKSHSFIANGFVSHNTPQHHKDLFHNVMRGSDGKIITDGRISDGEHKGFWCKMFPAITNEHSKEVLLPEVFNFDELIRIKETQGDLFFTREYMLKCIDDKKALFPFSLLKSCTDESENYLFSGEENKTYVIGVDVASSGAASADYTAAIVLEIRERKRKIKVQEENEDGEIVTKQIDSDSFISEKVVRHIFHEKGIDISKQIELIQDLAIRFNDALVLVERNNVGVALIQELQLRNVNVESFITDKFKKESAIRFLINEMQNGRIVFTSDDTYEMKKLKEELRNFGIKEARGKERMESLSGHDDLVSALWLANSATQNYTSSLAFAVVQD